MSDIGPTNTPSEGVDGDGLAPRAAAAAGDGDRFDGYLRAFESFFNTVGRELTSAAGEAPEAVLVTQVADALGDQVTSFVGYLESSLRTTALSAETRDLLDVQRVSELARTAEVALQQSIARGFLGQSLWWWLDFIAELIKKLVDAIWPNAPKWIIAILDIIDEMLELLKGIFTAVQGVSPTEVHAAGAALRVNSYNEQEAMVRLQAARNVRQATARSVEA